MTPFEETKKVNADMELIQVMKFMADEDLNEAPVVDDGHFIGMISRDRLLHFITVRAELEKAA